jgi:hypothetical protein
MLIIHEKKKTRNVLANSPTHGPVMAVGQTLGMLNFPSPTEEKGGAISPLAFIPLRAVLDV